MLTAIGIIIILAGLIIMFFGDKQIPVRGGVVLRIFEKRRHPEEWPLPEWSNKILFGGALIFGGIMVLLKASKLA